MATIKPLVQFHIDPEQLRRIDDWRFANRIGSRGEAIRRLLDLGLTAATQGFNKAFYTEPKG